MTNQTTAVKKYSPSTPSRRHMSVVRYKDILTTATPYKKLVKGGKRASGRNNAGRITTRHKGGGHKRRFRFVDFIYDKKDIPARIETLEYDPHRSGFIALVCYRDGERRYVLAPQKVAVGDEMIVSENAPLKPGNRLPLKAIPVGTFVYNVEIQPCAGARLARSAGNYAEVIGQDVGYTFIRLPSTEVRKIQSGRGHRRQRTKWGKPAGKGQKTRAPKKYSNKFIVSRRKVGKKQ